MGASIERSPDTIVAFRGPTSKGRKVEEGNKKVGEGRDRREKRKEKEGRDGKRGKGEKGSSARPLFRCSVAYARNKEEKEKEGKESEKTPSARSPQINVLLQP